MERLWAALSEVQDPEMPVNLVDLGVIYGINQIDGVVEVGVVRVEERELERADRCADVQLRGVIGEVGEPRVV